MVMENETMELFINGRKVRVGMDADPADCLLTSIDDIKASYQLIEEKYNADMDAFFACTFNSPDFLEKAEKWMDSQKRMISLARGIALSDPEDDEVKDLAMEKVNRAIRDARLLMHNLDAYYKRLLQKRCEDSKLLKSADSLSRKTMDHWTRADATQRRMQLKFYGGPSRGVPIEEFDDAHNLAIRYRARVPRGHIYLPPRPYPPERIPPGEPVPMLPKPFLAYRAIPPEELEYDEVHDEFVIPEGYVSEDGSIDHNSVRWDWDKMEVTFQFVDSVPVTWKFWKAKDLRDDLEGWGDEFTKRMYDQLLAYATKDPYGPQMLDEASLPYNKKFQ